MVRAAVLASGEGSRLQAVLDAIYFKEIPNIELVAVICPQRDAYAMKRALNADVPAYVVDPERITSNYCLYDDWKLVDYDLEIEPKDSYTLVKPA